MRNKFTAILVISSLALSSCATRSSSISAASISPFQYQNYTCEQVGQELTRVNGTLKELSAKQDGNANLDAFAMGVGLLLFWPALFFVIGGDNKEELSRLKGEHTALGIVAMGKECTTVMTEFEVERKNQEEMAKNGKPVSDGISEDNIRRNLEACLENASGTVFENECEDEADQARKSLRQMSNNAEEINDILTRYDKCLHEAWGFNEPEECVNDFSTKLIKLVPYGKAKKIEAIRQIYCDRGAINNALIHDCIEGKISKLNDEVKTLRLVKNTNLVDISGHQSIEPLDAEARSGGNKENLAECLENTMLAFQDECYEKYGASN